MDEPRTAWEAIGRRRFLIGAWPWRSAAYLLSGAAVATLAAVPLTVLCLPWIAAAGERPPMLLGAAGTLLAAGPWVAPPVARWELRRLRLVDRRPAPRITPRGRYTDPRAWRESGFLLLLLVGAPAVVVLLGLLLGLALAALVSPLLLDGDAPVTLGPVEVGTVGEALVVAVPAGVALLGSPYLVAAVAAGQARVVRWLLAGGNGLRAELVEVARSRARLVDAFEAERRRIERDLHDGAQQSLLGLTLQISLARLDVPADSPAAERLETAHRRAKELLTELRELVHGIHPRVLTDRGLAAALGELADRAPVPVTVDADLPRRLPGQIESAAYFVVAEALANAVKHGACTRVGLRASWRRGLLTVEIEDDGQGGADPAGGTGLTGLADRVSASDGRMFLSSPSGGPTTLRVELPCVPEAK